MWPWKDVSLGPITLPDGQFTMRTPRLSDATAWSAARLANREWLERAFPAWGDDWAAEQTEVAWAQRWWRLRSAALRGNAMPFVLLLDGRLVGEIGVDAVDTASRSGEASVWMVRDHGSSAVMNTASVLLLEHAFTCATPLDRLISPVATTSRKGRSPGLTAVGLAIEGTVARKVGDQGFVDHDIWVLHNTAESRARLAQFVAAMPSGSATVAEPAARPLPAAAVRAAVREIRNLAGHRLHRRGSVDALSTATDLGTGAFEVTIRPTDTVDAATLRAALDQAPAGTRPAVRVPPDHPHDELLRSLGLVPVAAFAGNPEGRSGWPGEQRWEPAGQAS